MQPEFISRDARVHPLAPVVALDIDGTLADYYGHFKWFAELYLQEYLHPDWSQTSEFSEALGLDKNTYRDIKLAYRQGGMKRSLPVIDDGVAQLVSRIRSTLQVQVWICTTRPWQRLDNIDPDTRWWIQRHLGRVDGVIYGEDKYRDLVDIVGKDRVLGIIDDLPENILAAQDLGLRAALRVGHHNLPFASDPVRQPLLAQSSHDIFMLTQEWSRIVHNLKENTDD
jgi:hypothetical protein